MDKEEVRKPSIRPESQLAAALTGLVEPRLAPLAGAALAFLDYARSFRADRISAMMQAATEESGRSEEELLEKACEDERLTDLLITAATAASRTQLEAKFKLLGKALASGLLAADDAQIDELEFTLRVVADLEATHLKVLQAFQRSATEQQVLGEEKVDELVPESRNVFSPIVATLERNGLVRSAAGAVGGAGHWSLTDYGREILRQFQEAGLEALRADADARSDAQPPAPK